MKQDEATIISNGHCSSREIKSSYTFIFLETSMVSLSIVFQSVLQSSYSSQVGMFNKMMNICIEFSDFAKRLFGIWIAWREKFLELNESGNLPTMSKSLQYETIVTQTMASNVFSWFMSRAQ